MSTETSNPKPFPHEKAKKKLNRSGLPTATVDKIDEYLDHFDASMHNNIKRHEPPEFPGMILPYTTIETRYTPPGTRRLTEKDYKTQLIVYTSGFSLPGDGHPIRPEIYYSLLFDKLKEAKETNQPTNITLVGVGHANGLGGHVTKDVYKALREKGFAIEGEIIASLTQQLLPKNGKREVIFAGTSMGALKAIKAVQHFHAEGVTKKVELEKPATLSYFDERYRTTGAQIIIGFLQEALIRKTTMDFKEEVLTPEYKQQLKTIFEASQLPTKDTFRQKVRKIRNVALDVRNILRENKHEKVVFDFPVLIKVGEYDRINVNSYLHSELTENKSVEHGNVHISFIPEGHASDYYKVEEWAKLLDPKPKLVNGKTASPLEPLKTLFIAASQNLKSRFGRPKE